MARHRLAVAGIAAALALSPLATTRAVAGPAARGRAAGQHASRHGKSAINDGSEQQARSRLRACIYFGLQQ